MHAITAVLVAGFFILAIPLAHAEDCMVASTPQGAAPRYTPVSLDLANGTRLDPAVLPSDASALMCLRPSIVPRADDVRVMSEWRIVFGIAERGPRVLWIWASAGTLEFRVENGHLSTTERNAVNQWLETAQPRFVLGWTER